MSVVFRSKSDIAEPEANIKFKTKFLPIQDSKFWQRKQENNEITLVEKEKIQQ